MLILYILGIVLEKEEEKKKSNQERETKKGRVDLVFYSVKVNQLKKCCGNQ